MSVSVTYDKVIKKQSEIKVFNLNVCSTENINVFLRFENLNAVCYNCSGKNYLGEVFEKTVKLKKDTPHNFWCEVSGEGNGYVVILSELGKEIFRGEIAVVKADERFKKRLQRRSQKNSPASEADCLKENDLSKLTWLNSDIGIDHSVPKPFIPLVCVGNAVKILGREIKFDDLGFPLELNCYFNKSAKICDEITPILSEKILFCVGNEEFSNISKSVKSYDDSVIFSNVNESENFIMFVDASVEFDGFLSYKTRLVCKNDIEINDAFLSLALTKNCLKYFIGLGKKGGLFDKKVNWKWNEDFNQDGFWVGDVNAGLKIKFKGENYVKPFVNIYYNHRKLKRPESWDNSGRGGIIFENDCFTAYSGKRSVKKGESLRFDFELLLTPLKEIDLKKQFSMRFFHTMFDSETWLKRAKEGGANIINVHHGNDLNPFINYPFAEEKALKDFVKNAHENQISVKVYYTIRELTVNMPEFRAFRDFDYEIISKRNENVEILSWQQEAKKWIDENVGSDVIPAWKQPLKGKKYKGFYDSAVITEGQSRLCNFYVEGLNRLIEETDVDGIYIDDVAYDRNTMKRVRKVLDKKEKAYIDFHQWNHYADIAGKSNCAVLYAELYPYVDKCWIGEGFDYDESPEFWLTEISGIPFGVMSEMMDTGNQYRGLLFGMTNRLGWETNESDPLNVWKIFDDYNLGEAELVGWWDDRNGVVLSNPIIRASEYRVKNKRYIAIANFSNEEQKTDIYLKGENDYYFYAPEIERFQKEQTAENVIKLGGKQGLFLIVEQK